MIKGFVTHRWPHLDEIAAMWALCKWGDEVADPPEIVYWEAGGKTADQWEKGGYLCVGVGGSELDEHPQNGTKREEGECAFSLTLKKLGVESDPALQAMVKAIANEDAHAGLGSLGIPTGVKVLHEMHPEEPFAAYVWAVTWMEAEHERQRRFFETDFESRVEWREIPYNGKINGKMLKLAIIRCEGSIRAELSQLAAVARSKGASIVVQRWESGHTQIFTRKWPRIDLRDVARVLRIEEQRLKGQRTVTDWKLLEASGKVDGTQEWCFMPEAPMILNGSLTALDTPPTSILVEGIIEFVRVGVNQASLHKDCGLPKNQGCIRGRCPWYGWGLLRCRKARYVAAQDGR